MANKFFYNRVYNTKRTIVNFIIIGVCVIGVILCFVFTSNFQGENQNAPQGELSIKKVVTVEVNEKFKNDIFFSKIENVDVDKLEVKYPSNYDISKPGKYTVALNISDTNYEVTLNVVDTSKPVLALKSVTITEGNIYSANDFVESCTDNSNSKCNISFYEGLDEEGNNVSYDKYKAAGTYVVKVLAKDDSGNQTVAETKLIIMKNNSTIPNEQPVICKYGNGDYDKTNYIIAIFITSNNCAVSIDSYKDTAMTADINKLMDTETIKIKRDIEALNLTGTLALNRKVSAIVNKSGSGVVGYELRMTVTLTDALNKSKIAADYKIDENGNRVFIENPYNLK